jgi:hypothetical protein
MPLSGRLLRGTRLEFRFESTAHDLEVTPFTIVATGPEVGRVVPEVVWRWRPGSTSDPEFNWDDAGGYLEWTLTSAWTRSGFTVGDWTLYFLVGEPGTTQDNMTDYKLNVRDGRAGPMPVS